MILYCDDIAVGEKWRLGLVADCWNETAIEGVEAALLDELISILVVAGCFDLRARGGTPPFRPLPFGMLVVNRLVTLGAFFFFSDKNLRSCPATATEWEQIPSDFQLGQLESQLKSPFFLGVTRCGGFPL